MSASPGPAPSQPTLPQPAEPRAGDEPHRHRHSKCVVGEAREAGVAAGRAASAVGGAVGAGQTPGALQDLVPALS